MQEVKKDKIWIPNIQNSRKSRTQKVKKCWHLYNYRKMLVHAWHLLTRARLEGVWTPPIPRGFFAIAKKRRRCAPFGQLFRNFPENLSPGHQRSGHQIRWSDPSSKKITIAWRPQWLRERYETFIIWHTAKYLQLVYLRFFISVT